MIEKFEICDCLNELLIFELLFGNLVFYFDNYVKWFYFEIYFVMLVYDFYIYLEILRYLKNIFY